MNNYLGGNVKIFPNTRSSSSNVGEIVHLQESQSSMPSKLNGMDKVSFIHGSFSKDSSRSSTQIPSQQNVTFDVAKSNVIRTIFMETFLAQEKQQSNLVRDLGSEVELNLDFFDHIQGINRVR